MMNLVLVSGTLDDKFDMLVNGIVQSYGFIPLMGFAVASCNKAAGCICLFELECAILLAWSLDI